MIGTIKPNEEAVFDVLTRDLVVWRVRFRIGDAAYEKEVAVHLSGGESVRIEIDESGNLVTRRE